jgi:hypothetical protein
MQWKKKRQAFCFSDFSRSSRSPAIGVKRDQPSL